MRLPVLPVVIWTLCSTSSPAQTGCQDINTFCGEWAGSGLCSSQRQFMQEQCRRTCGSCRVTEVLFPKPSIAKPDFICGLYHDTENPQRVKRGSFWNAQSRSIDTVDDVSPSAENGPDQLYNSHSEITLPIFSHLLPARSPVTFRSTQLPTDINHFSQTSLGIIASSQQLDSTAEPQDFTIFETAVGGGSDASTPSVGIVLVVDTSRPTIRPTTLRQPTQFPVVPRPTIVQGPTPVTVRPGGSIPSPNIVQPITPTPVTQPIPVTSAVIPLSIGSETLDDAICGSVPITDRFLLSAAHCFSNQSVSYRIRLGELDVSQTSEINSRPQDVDVEKIFIHPDYSHSSGVRYNDIALLKTVQRIRFSPLVFPFCVLPKPIDITGAPVTVAGFGLVNGTYRSPVLQAAELRGLNDALCEERYKSLGYDLALRNRYPNLLVGKGLLCASTPGKSACQGDSGGPLTLQDRNGQLYVLGVVSIGASCLGNSLSVLPGLYTDVAFHIDWINEVIYGS